MNEIEKPKNVQIKPEKTPSLASKDKGGEIEIEDELKAPVNNKEPLSEK